MSIKDKLSLLIEELQRHNSPVIPLLQNGPTQDEIDNVIKPLGLNFPGELYELYSWKNGIAEKFENIGRFPLFPTGIFLDFYSATKVYPKKEGKIKHWKKNMFPVFGMANEYYLIDIDNASNTYGVIYYYSGDKKTIAYFDSIESCIDTIYYCYKENIFTLDRTTYPNFPLLQYDPTLFKQISKKNNPNSKFWKD